MNSMNIHKVLEYLPHRYPFLLIDRVLSYEPGKEVRALKNVTINEPFFNGHFPHHPVMPGVLIIEAMAQAAWETLSSGASTWTTAGSYCSTSPPAPLSPSMPEC